MVMVMVVVRVTSADFEEGRFLVFNHFLLDR